MGILDWLITDPAQSDGGFLAALLNGGMPGGGAGGSAPANAGSSGLLGESPLINLLRSGFAGMNAANGYDGFGSQFAAGVTGGAEAMARRRQQMIQDRLNSLALNKAMTGQDPQSAGAPGSPADTASRPSATHCPGNCGGHKPPAGMPPSGDANGAGANDPNSTIAGASPNMPIRVETPEDAARLAPGTWFRTPDGRTLRRGAVGGE